MSLKAVELQIAIPKTMDAGKMAEQHQQNVMQQQHHANEAVKKEMERKQVTVMDTASSSKITDEQNSDSNEKESGANQKDTKQKNQLNKDEAKHPYKGHFIDFSG